MWYVACEERCTAVSFQPSALSHPHSNQRQVASGQLERQIALEFHERQAED